MLITLKESVFAAFRYAAERAALCGSLLRGFNKTRCDRSQFPEARHERWKARSLLPEGIVDLPRMRHCADLVRLRVVRARHFARSTYSAEANPQSSYDISKRAGLAAFQAQ